MRRTSLYYVFGLIATSNAALPREEECDLRSEGQAGLHSSHTFHGYTVAGWPTPWRTTRNRGDYLLPKDTTPLENGDGLVGEELSTLNALPSSETSSANRLGHANTEPFSNLEINPRAEPESQTTSSSARIQSQTPSPAVTTTTPPFAELIPTSSCGAPSPSPNPVSAPDGGSSSSNNANASPSAGADDSSSTTTTTTPTTLNPDDYAEALAQLSAFCDAGGSIPPYTHTAAQVGGAVVYICARGHGEACSGQNLTAVMAWLDRTCGGGGTGVGAGGQLPAREGWGWRYRYEGPGEDAAAGPVPGWVYGDVAMPGSPASKIGRSIVGTDFC
jgi:hypothetical protein